MLRFRSILLLLICLIGFSFAGWWVYYEYLLSDQTIAPGIQVNHAAPDNPVRRLNFTYTIPITWTQTFQEEWDTGSLVRYSYQHEIPGKSMNTNIFTFERAWFPNVPDLTLELHTQAFVQQLETRHDLSVVTIEQGVTTVGRVEYPATTVRVTNLAKQEEDYYVLTLVDGLVYHFSTLYFIDEREQILADMQTVTDSFAVN